MLESRVQEQAAGIKTLTQQIESGDKGEPARGCIESVEHRQSVLNFLETKRTGFCSRVHPYPFRTSGLTISGQ